MAKKSKPRKPSSTPKRPATPRAMAPAHPKGQGGADPLRASLQSLRARIV